MVPPATGADGAGNECFICFSVHGFHNLTHQTTPGVFGTPVAAACLGAVTGKTKPFFRLADLLTGNIDEGLVNNDRLIEVLNVAGSILNTEKGSAGFSRRTGAE